MNPFLIVSSIAILLFVIILTASISVINKKNDSKSTKNLIFKNKKDNVKEIKTEEETLESLFIRAGIFTDDDKARFNRKKIAWPIIMALFGVIVGLKFSGFLILLSIIIFTYIGLKIPNKILNKRIKERDEDILYYLPIVIEQLVVGVSSALDIGPCIAYVVDMAEKRGTHNPVTLLLKQVQMLVRFGASLDDALADVGRASCHNELKNSFLQLAQVTKHGGEITKQLQDLGTTVTRQREVIIDSRIKTLELKATGPVFLVFAGNMVILLGLLFMGIISKLQ